MLCIGCGHTNALHVAVLFMKMMDVSSSPLQHTRNKAQVDFCAGKSVPAAQARAVPEQMCSCHPSLSDEKEQSCG